VTQSDKTKTTAEAHPRQGSVKTIDTSKPDRGTNKAPDLQGLAVEAAVASRPPGLGARASISRAWVTRRRAAGVEADRQAARAAVSSRACKVLAEAEWRGRNKRPEPGTAGPR